MTQPSLDEFKEKIENYSTRFSAQSLCSNAVPGSGRRFTVPPRALWDNMTFLLKFLEDFIFVGEISDLSVRCTSGYRSEDYNNYLKNELGRGVSDRSQHSQCRAIDIVVQNGKLDVLKRHADQVFQEVSGGFNMGLGFYSNFIHIDVGRMPWGNSRPHTWLNGNIPRQIGTLNTPDRASTNRYGGELTDDLLTPRYDMIGEAGERETLRLSVEDTSRFLTPEEYRKGIVPQIFYINDWHLSQMGNKEMEDEKNAPDNFTPEQTLADIQSGQNTESSETNSTNNIRERADLSTDFRRRYVMSLVDAEFYRRRYSSRTVPASTGVFNPYPVVGFPCLIMTPGRPIIANISNISHQISVSGASGTTTISMDGPRYWDEGDVWHWMGGWDMNMLKKKGHDASGYGHYYRRFPSWHNRYTMATNNVDPDNLERTGKSDLDKFYNFMIGCDSVEYLSNNHDRVFDTNKLEAAIKDRRPADFEVSSQTLEIKDYNHAIAATDDNGRFKRGTIAHRIWGAVKPYESLETRISVSPQVEYVERYGATERELMVDFLGNRYVKQKGILSFVGPTFDIPNSEKEGNSLQKAVIEYIEDIESRSLGHAND